MSRTRLSKADTAERDLVGAAVLDPSVVDQFAAYVRIEDFAMPPAAEVWRRLVRLRADPFAFALAGEDWMSAVMTAAWDWGNEEPRGTFGPAFVSDCMMAAPTVEGALFAYRVMREEAVRRRFAESLHRALDGLKTAASVALVARILRNDIAGIPEPDDGAFLASLEDAQEAREAAERKAEPLPEPWAAHLTRKA